MIWWSTYWRHTVLTHVSKVTSVWPWQHFTDASQNQKNTLYWITLSLYSNNNNKSSGDWFCMSALWEARKISTMTLEQVLCTDCKVDTGFRKLIRDEYSGRVNGPLWASFVSHWLIRPQLTDGSFQLRMKESWTEKGLVAAMMWLLNWSTSSEIQEKPYQWGEVGYLKNQWGVPPNPSATISSSVIVEDAFPRLSHSSLTAVGHETDVERPDLSFS